MGSELPFRYVFHRIRRKSSGRSSKRPHLRACRRIGRVGRLRPSGCQSGVRLDRRQISVSSRLPIASEYPCAQQCWLDDRRAYARHPTKLQRAERRVNPRRDPVSDFALYCGAAFASYRLVHSAMMRSRFSAIQRRLTLAMRASAWDSAMLGGICTRGCATME